MESVVKLRGRESNPAERADRPRTPLTFSTRKKTWPVNIGCHRPGAQHRRCGDGADRIGVAPGRTPQRDAQLTEAPRVFCLEIG